MSSRTNDSRKGIIAALVFTGFFVGLMVGGFLAGNFWVDKSDGLAGGAMVLFYALLFALLIAVAGGIAGKRLPRSQARRLAWAGAPIAVAILAWVAWRIVENRNATKDAEEAAYANLLPFRIEVAGSIGPDIERYSYDYFENRLTARVNGRACSAQLEGRSRLALLTALRGVDGMTIECMDCNDESTKVSWQIDEALGTINRGEFYISDTSRPKNLPVSQLLTAVVDSVEQVCSD